MNRRSLPASIALCLALSAMPTAALAADAPSALPFTDVAADAWYHDDVAYAYTNDLMWGVSGTQFAPALTTSRGMLVTILHRLEGGPSAEAAPFDDVPEDQWYSDAVDWAAANEIVQGYSADRFVPAGALTREQCAAILYRYAEHKGYDVSASASLSAYTDAEKVSSYAEEAMQWAVAIGLIRGRTGTILEPQGTATRAETAAMLSRFASYQAEQSQDLYQVTLKDDAYLDLTITKDGQPVSGIVKGDAMDGYQINVSVKEEHADLYKLARTGTVTIGGAEVEGVVFRPSGDVDFPEGTICDGDVVIDSELETFEIAQLTIRDQDGELFTAINDRSGSAYIGDTGFKVFLDLEEGYEITSAKMVTGVAEGEVELIAVWDGEAGAWAVKDSEGGQGTLSGIIEDIEIVITIQQVEYYGVTLADDTYLDFTVTKDGQPVPGIGKGDTMDAYKINVSVKEEHASLYKPDGTAVVTIGGAEVEGIIVRPSGDVDFPAGTVCDGDIVIDPQLETFQVANITIRDQDGELFTSLSDRGGEAYIGDKGFKLYVDLEEGYEITSAKMVKGVAEGEVELIAMLDEAVGSWVIKDSQGGQSTLSGIIEDIEIVITIEPAA